MNKTYQLIDVERQIAKNVCLASAETNLNGFTNTINKHLKNRLMTKNDKNESATSRLFPFDAHKKKTVLLPVSSEMKSSAIYRQRDAFLPSHLPFISK